MSGATDSGMVKTMGIVMACLAVLAVVCVLAARLLGIGSTDFDDPVQRSALLQRIQPIAAVRTSADEMPADNVVASASAAKSGEELVGGACAACHLSGAAGAPKLDDDAAWAARRESGLDTLVASVINGKGAMPARGGSAYSDDEIKLAVQHMAGFEVAAAEEPAAEEPAADDSGSDEAVSEEAASEDTANADAASEPADTEQADAATDEASEEASVEVGAAQEAGADAAAAPLVVGQVPEGLTDNIRASVDGVCAGCHLGGVAGAPKTGDTVAWQERADKGLAALTSSVINGLNVMPPRGGSTLTDEEIPVAIQYLMSK